MLELMTWSEIVDSLRAEGNLTMAAVFDTSGEKLAATDGVQLTKGEVGGSNLFNHPGLRAIGDPIKR